METSLIGWLISVRPSVPPKSADLTKEGRARDKNIMRGEGAARALHPSYGVALCRWLCWENSKWRNKTAGS